MQNGGAAHDGGSGLGADGTGETRAIRAGQVRLNWLSTNKVVAQTTTEGPAGVS